VGTTCVTVLCMLFRIPSVASQNNDLPFSTVGMVCVFAVGFGNGSPGAEYGTFLCAVLGGINTKTMQLGGGQVMRGHGREMALLPNAAKICVY